MDLALNNLQRLISHKTQPTNRVILRTTNVANISNQPTHSLVSSQKLFLNLQEAKMYINDIIQK